MPKKTAAQKILTLVIRIIAHCPQEAVFSPNASLDDSTLKRLAAKQAGARFIGAGL
jgi:hypothetical protein